jgi:hypothetical protein
MPYTGIGGEGTAAYFRAKAEQCWRLALSISNPDDPVAQGLRALAVAFDEKADALEQKERDPT